mmetsp:Transcript_31076/g.103854  ORF Transcript_31076/g.103854 Transcript_31076/m.103854 type:complete len:128 (-) Transcript_31076:122-505(-)
MTTQLFDAVKPRDRRFITLTDVRRSGMGPLFFSAMTNVHKLLAGELADAAAARLAQTTRHLTDWDRWAHAEYERLEAEEEEEMAHSYGESRDVPMGGPDPFSAEGAVERMELERSFGSFGSHEEILE